MRFRSAPPGALILLVLAGACSSHGSDAKASPSPPAAPASGRTPVPVHVRGVGTARTPTVLSESKNGRRVYTIRAMQFEGDIAGATEGNAAVQEPHVTFVGANGTPTYADAPKATVDQRDKSVVMTGGVHARTEEGSTLDCDTLRYDTATERFDGEGHVVLRGQNGVVLTGDHLHGDVRLQDVQVTSGGAR